jgi:hypothetical protein
MVLLLQHIFYALTVGAAWAFPLQFHSLRVLLMAGLFCVNVVQKLYFYNLNDLSQ